MDWTNQIGYFSDRYPLMQRGGGFQQMPNQVVVQQPRIQAVLSAGAVKNACERAVAKCKSDADKAVSDALAQIMPLPETTETRIVKGWLVNRKEIVVNIPTDDEQRLHREQMEQRAAEMASYYQPPAQVKTLLGLAAHYGPDQMMPLEGDYVVAIAEYLEPSP